jgi:serine phosphatase RsbU (regulator of sigma subunit)/lipopolysaccharide biosynthesis regulator YciM
MKIKAFLYFLFLSNIFICQESKTDSLYRILLKCKIDTSKVNRLNDLAFEFRSKNPDSSIYYSKLGLELSQKINYELGQAESFLWLGTANLNIGKNEDALINLTRAKIIFENLKLKAKKESYRIKKNLANTYNTIGNAFITLGDFDNALKNQKEALAIRQIIHDKTGISSSFNNLALIYSNIGNYAESLKNHFASLKIKELLNNKKGMAISYNNIGLIYKDQGNNEQAIKYLQKSLEISKEIGLINILATCYLNIGAIYTNQKKYNEALVCLQTSYNLAKEEDSKDDISNALGNIGALYLEKKEYEKAIKNVTEALKLKNEIGDNIAVASFMNSLCQIYLKKGDLNNSIAFGEKSLKLSTQLKALNMIKESSESLFLSYDKKGDYKNAYKMQSLFYRTKDSVLNKNNQQEVIRQEFKYNYDKQALSDSLSYESKKKIAILESQAKSKSEKNKRITLYIGLIAVILFSIFIFNRFRITKKQKNIIELQSHKLEITHQKLEHKTKEIKDSILYSKEIQNTFLKSPTNSENYFKDTFLLYRPKDVVSGDFYWYKEIYDELYLVVGDCTGHGVPGAIISVLAIQSLEKTIHLLKSHNQLHELNTLLKEEFNAYYKVDGHVSIGLDYSIVCINKKQNKIYISGSGNTILIKTIENDLQSYKFDTINIGGKSAAIYEPTTEIFPLQSIQSIFLFTDGVIDQKGFENGKKFGTKQLKEMISNLNTKNSEEALMKIENQLSHWMGTIDQVDDMTLLGIQINQSNLI